MKLFSILVLVNLAAFCGGAQAAKVLALLENLALKETHSMYFKRLTDAGQEVSFKVAEDPSIEIKKDGKNLYDHLVIFSPTVEELRGSLSGEDIGEFIHDGGNLLIAGSSRGGDVITDHQSLRVLDILTGCSFSSHNREDPITEYPNATGKNPKLIAGLQARNNGRVIFTGSMDLFSDEKFSSLVQKTGSGVHGVSSSNADRAKALSAWCSEMAGVVRIDSVQHHLASFSNQSSMKQDSIIIAHFQRCIAIIVVALVYTTHMTPDAGLALLAGLAHIALSVISQAITLVSSRLFLNFLKNTSDIPVPHLVLLGAILIISGFLLLGPSSPLPFQKSLTTLIFGGALLGLGIGASGAAVISADRSFVSDYSGPWYQDVKFLCKFDVLVIVIGGMAASFCAAQATNIDRAIHLLIAMEVVSMLLAPLIFLI